MAAAGQAASVRLEAEDRKREHHEIKQAASAAFDTFRQMLGERHEAIRERQASFVRDRPRDA